MTTGADDSYAREQELKEQRARWEQQRKARKEQEEREAKQAELAKYLDTRGREWADTTGSAPTSEELRLWRREYMDRIQAERDAEREAQIARAMDDLGI